MASNEDNDDADSVTAQAGDFYEERAANLRPVEPEVVVRPTSTLEANILASRPSTSTRYGFNLKKCIFWLRTFFKRNSKTLQMEYSQIE